jgi:transposase
MRKTVEGQGAGRRPRRAFTSSFKAEVVALVRQGDRTIPTICREMDLSETAVRRWVEQAAVDAGDKDGLTTEEREELRRLRREVRVLRDERDILKRAAVGSMGRRNGVGVAATGGGDAHGTDGSAWALRGEEAGAVAPMEGWRVAE